MLWSGLPAGAYVLTLVSDGQTGVGRGAVQAAINLGMSVSGWAPDGMADEDGAMPAIVAEHLRASSSGSVGMVRRLNCQDSDGALCFSTAMVLVGVPAFVDKVTEQMGRAFLHVTLPQAGCGLSDALRLEVIEWIRDNGIGRLYVTGSSESDSPGIADATRRVLTWLLEPIATEEALAVTEQVRMIAAELDKIAASPGDQ
jgi:hypothetical protein